MAVETRKFVTEGMHCPSCSMLIEMNLSDVDGVESVSSDYKSGITEVSYDPAVVTPDEIVAEIESAGYQAHAA